MLFFGDVWVVINVCFFEGGWVIGMCVLVVVYQVVFGEGWIWLDCVFVVKDWYILVYELLSNNCGQCIGMFYVGFFDGFFVIVCCQVFVVVVGFFVLVMGVVGVFVVFWVCWVFKLIECMYVIMYVIELGDVEVWVGVVVSQDELGVVVEYFDWLFDCLQVQVGLLKCWGELFDVKVVVCMVELEQVVVDLKVVQL